MAVILLGLTKVVDAREPWLMLILVIPGLYFTPLIKKPTIGINSNRPLT
jgi:hypothetical protein